MAWFAKLPTSGAIEEHEKTSKIGVENRKAAVAEKDAETRRLVAGATVLVNLSASNVLAGKSHYRHQLVAQQSARCLAAYLYTSAGRGESSTDMAWDGQALIYEKGTWSKADFQRARAPVVQKNLVVDVAVFRHDLLAVAARSQEKGRRSIP